ncbi:MAG: hypothetical protein ACREV4_14675 [Gammaproteobacteria bacterium]
MKLLKNPKVVEAFHVSLRQDAREFPANPKGSGMLLEQSLLSRGCVADLDPTYHRDLERSDM